MKELGEITFSQRLEKGGPFKIKECADSPYMDVEVVAITKQEKKYLAHVQRTETRQTSDMWDNKVKSLGRIARSGLRCPITFI